MKSPFDPEPIAHTTKIIRSMADAMHKDALAKYNHTFSLYNVSRLYSFATNGKSADYAVRLQDAALAMCGSPYSKVEFFKNEIAMMFLAEFA